MMVVEEYFECIARVGVCIVLFLWEGSFLPDKQTSHQISQE